MGEMSYRAAAKKWRVSHMTLFAIVNPEPGKDVRPPRREDLLKIAQGDERTYRQLALAAYGILEVEKPSGERNLVPAL